MRDELVQVAVPGSHRSEDAIDLEVLSQGRSGEGEGLVRIEIAVAKREMRLHRASLARSSSAPSLCLSAIAWA